MFNLILNDLKKKFEGKILLTPSDISEIIGVGIGQQANMRSNDTFPIPWSKDFGRVKINIYDLAYYLSNYQNQTPITYPKNKIAPRTTRGHLEKNWWTS